MTTAFEVPLTPQPQLFQIALAGTSYFIRIAWNTSMSAWVLDLLDADRLPILNGVPLVTGLDLLAQYRYLGIPGSLVVQTDSDNDALPTFENLGINSHLFFVTEA